MDEPTAGLDPAERNRLHRTLAEVGERTPIILSTHIVEDVANLCRRLAVLQGGRIRREGSPEALLKPLEGRLWTAVLDRAALQAWSERVEVVSTRVRAGATAVVVQADAAPGAEFTPKTPDLEDVYFLTVPQAEA